jgi:hypothetical protein
MIENPVQSPPDTPISELRYSEYESYLLLTNFFGIRAAFRKHCNLFFRGILFPHEHRPIFDFTKKIFH